MCENKVDKKEIRIPEMYLNKIEQVIGAAVDPNDEGKFASFRAVDEITKSIVRNIFFQIDELRAKAYLNYVLHKNVERGYIFSYLFDVIVDGMSIDDWERGKEKLSSSSRN
ncbi:MAG: hypothetical protein KKA68_19860 [Gammaproteobacteria bacterium]|nr:hypothetical protein [Gammaproteobacteria bacterium]MBU2072497.1 hypothetical protein [Gammaproteobacteria bacterium]